MIGLSNMPDVDAVGWSLLHSIWQILVIYLSHLIAQRLLKRAESSFRYWAAVVMLFLCLLVPCLTAVAMSAGWLHAPFANTLTEINPETGFYNLPLNVPLPKWPQWASSANSLLNFIAVIWVCVATFRLYHLLATWRDTATIRGVGQPIDPPAQWERLANRIVSGRTVRFLELPHISSAATMGWLKPIIILPVGFAAGLAPSEVEAVIAHELAHIKRRDYFVSLLQSCVECLLFYHPCVRLISWNVHCLREECCDDIAIDSTGGERKSFAQALIAASGFTPVPALGLAGGSIADRVRRLKEKQQRPESRGHRRVTGVLGPVLILLLIVCSMSARALETNRWFYEVQNESKGTAMLGALGVSMRPNPDLASTIAQANSLLKAKQFDLQAASKCADVINRGGDPYTLYRDGRVNQFRWQKIAHALIAQAIAAPSIAERQRFARAALILCCQDSGTPEGSFLEEFLTDEKRFALFGLPREKVKQLQTIFSICLSRDGNALKQYILWKEKKNGPVPDEVQRLAKISPMIESALAGSPDIVYIDITNRRVMKTKNAQRPNQSSTSSN